jgi:hypothetical protein
MSGLVAILLHPFFFSQYDWSDGDFRLCLDVCSSSSGVHCAFFFCLNFSVTII